MNHVHVATRIGFALAASVTAGSAVAQMYTFSESTATSGINVFFGSAKDSDGNLLSDVTVSLNTDSTTYVIVTDDAGRFRLGVPKSLLPPEVTFSCSKPGYSQVKAVTRPPPNKALYPVQANCVLNRRSPAVK